MAHTSQNRKTPEKNLSKQPPVQNDFWSTENSMESLFGTVKNIVSQCTDAFKYLQEDERQLAEQKKIEMERNQRDHERRMEEERIRFESAQRDIANKVEQHREIISKNASNASQFLENPSVIHPIFNGKFSV